uniref:Uncharacterized protein n=1 Tax=Zea mays TaxID=4577 RepID=B6SLX9_MAIZE|nr:hypothetical protein [Zea mays]
MMYFVHRVPMATTAAVLTLTVDMIPRRLSRPCGACSLLLAEYQEEDPKEKSTQCY